MLFMVRNAIYVRYIDIIEMNSNRNAIYVRYIDMLKMNSNRNAI
jgi:hypothetical protein